MVAVATAAAVLAFAVLWGTERVLARIERARDEIAELKHEVRAVRGRTDG
ncbi:MAG: hypothetical protein OXQ31_26560 [Spirochaetaceae bacterium]|nr:hypothetical protein [Spirochaetaceae bacterium]